MLLLLLPLLPLLCYYCGDDAYDTSYCCWYCCYYCYYYYYHYYYYYDDDDYYDHYCDRKPDPPPPLPQPPPPKIPAVGTGLIGPWRRKSHGNIGHRNPFSSPLSNLCALKWSKGGWAEQLSPLTATTQRCEAAWEPPGARSPGSWGFKTLRISACGFGVGQGFRGRRAAAEARTVAAASVESKEPTLKKAAQSLFPVSMSQLA